MDLLQPDDFHHHLREGGCLKDVVKLLQGTFNRLLVMPNLSNPVSTLESVLAYKKEITASQKELFTDAAPNRSFAPLMTLYLTDSTVPTDILSAFNSGLVIGAKLYPAGATTHSQNGVSDITKLNEFFKTMEDMGMPLLVHGEVADSSVDIFEREQVFIDSVLRPLMATHPALRIVLEHISTAYAVDFVTSCADNVVATITAHHLLYSYNDMFGSALNPHLYCRPVLKSEANRQALIRAATSGNPKFFIGTDSAPHSVQSKTCCGAAGVFTAHAAIELYAEVFEAAGALDRLEGFCSVFGARFYGLPLATTRIQLVREEWLVPERYAFGEDEVVPCKAGETLKWKIIGKNY